MLGPTTWWNHLYYSVVPDPVGLGWHFWALEGGQPRGAGRVDGAGSRGGAVSVAGHHRRMDTVGSSSEGERRGRRPLGGTGTTDGRRDRAALALMMHWDYGFAYTNDAAWYAHLVRTSTGSPRPVGWARDQQVAALLEAGRVDEALEKAIERVARYSDAPKAKMMLGLALEAAG